MADEPGRWWRFERYEVRDGLIRPAAGACLVEYEPWRDYQSALVRPTPSGGVKRLHTMAYQTLTNLVVDIDLERHADGAWHFAHPAAEARVLEWVNAHGLLGILPHLTEAVVLPLQKQGEGPYETQGAPGVIGRRYDRDPSGRWLETARTILPEHNLPFDERSSAELQAWRELKKDDVLPSWASREYEELWPNYHRPGAIFWSLLSFDDLGSGLTPSLPPGAENMGPRYLAHQPFTQTWARFFPHVPAKRWDTFIYPRPLTEAFWRAYAEPIYDFVCWAKALALMVTLIESPHGRDQLSWLLRSVLPRVLIDPERGPIVEWLSPSLLGSLAMMAVLDATEGRHPRTCTACGRFFVSSAYQAQYCSTRCRERVHKQNLRDRMKQAAALAAAGQSVREVAHELGIDVEIASKWLQGATADHRRKLP